MPAASPAWKPQATLALLTMPSMAASSPMRQAPKLSPRSLLRSSVLTSLYPDEADTGPGAGGRASEGA